MIIRTGRGDKGMTDLWGHKRVSKSSAAICAIGELDELNCFLGIVKLKTRSRKDRAIIERIQHGVSSMASEIMIGHERRKKLGPLLKKDDADWINMAVCRLEQNVKIRKCFYFPGDGELSVLFDIARAVARRAERSVVKAIRRDKARNDNILSYINCVSDVLFILARGAEKKTPKK